MIVFVHITLHKFGKIEHYQVTNDSSSKILCTFISIILLLSFSSGYVNLARRTGLLRISDCVEIKFSEIEFIIVHFMKRISIKDGK